MHAPGVEVRPLRQMTGGASFNEVFFTDVRIPDGHRLGEVNEGWSVALATLMNERAAIGGGGGGGALAMARLVELVRHTGRAGDPLVRQAAGPTGRPRPGGRLQHPAGDGQGGRRPGAGSRAAPSPRCR